MAQPNPESWYCAWSDADRAADQALAASTVDLRRADGLLDPALDPVFARLKPKPRPADQIRPRP